MLAEDEKTQIGVQSLEVGLTVLDTLIEKNEPIMLKELAALLDMHPAKVHRYVVSLIRKGYANQLSDGRYCLGERANSFGMNAIKNMNMVELVQPFLSEIQRHLNCSIHISKWLVDSPVVIQSLESGHVINVLTRVGSRMPLVNSSTGRLHSCYQPERFVHELLKAEWKKKSGMKVFPSNWDQFKECKDSILNNGYSLATGEMMIGINAISIPVFSLGNQLDHVITCIGTEEQLPKENMDAAINYLLEMKLKINTLIA